MNRILFVDDEPMVLEALRNSLRGKRKQWEMVFSDSGAGALLELERAPFDVIVSDMRMPKMNGAVFLGHASKSCPKATRIVLSGHAEESTLARAALTAHCYLTKPCSNEVLCSAISSAIELQALLASDRVCACIGGIESLPTVPSVYRALTAALQSERCSPDLVARIVGEDVGISAKLLHLVNSSFFGLPRKTTSLLQTVQYLGLATIRSLVLAHSLFGQLGQVSPALAEEGQEHALRCARIARQVLKGRPDADLAFIAGLLHDVGSLVLASRMPDEYAAIAAHARAAGLPLHVVERERLGVDHAGVGAYLLGLWGLPPEVLNVVAFHHTPWLASMPLDAASAVRLAEVISLEGSEGAVLGHPPAEPIPVGWIESMNLASAVAEARQRVES
jgi:HD-like signal output (HDOD) protein/CheY-like chemotaxis protein